jgi:hypothetical protein
MRVSAYWIALVAFTLARAVLLFGSVELALSDRPVMNGDYALHAYQSVLGVTFLAERQANSGYDPFFMAGYPKTPYYDGSLAPFEITALVVPGVFRAVKALVIATPLLVLGLMVIALRGFGLDPTAVRIGAGLTVALSWMSLPVVLLMLGMAGNLLGVALALAALGLLHRMLQEPARGPAVLFALAGALAIHTHPHGVAVLGLFSLALSLAATHRGIALRAALMAWLAVALAPYVATLAQFRDRIDPDFQVYWALARAAEPFHYYFDFGDGARQAGVLELALLVLAVAELLRWHRAGRWAARGYLAALGVLFVLCFWGARSRFLASLEPLRFTVSLAYLSLVPASALLARTLQGGGSRERIVMAGGGALIVALLAAGTPAMTGLLRVGPDATERALADWIVRHVPADGRVLIEDSAVGGPLGEAEASGGGVLPLLPLMTGRSFVGGPTAAARPRAFFANLIDARLFGRPVEAVDGLPARLDRYGISAALVWSASAYRAVVKAGMRPAGRVGRLVGLVRPDPGRAISGRAKIRPGPGGLLVDDAVAGPDGRLVLSWHHDPLLECDPPARLTGVTLGDDPVPFLAVDQPPRAFVIRTRGMGSITPAPAPAR